MTPCSLHDDVDYARHIACKSLHHRTNKCEINLYHVHYLSGYSTENIYNYYYYEKSRYICVERESVKRSKKFNVCQIPPHMNIFLLRGTYLCSSGN